MENTNRDYEIGKAGEHLVCADLIMKGYKAFMVEHACHYDIILEHEGKLLKIQVKATRGPKAKEEKEKTDSYLFHTMVMGKGSKKRYTKEQIDIIAVVALDKNEIAYVPVEEGKYNMSFKIEKSDCIKAKGSRYFKDYPLERCLNKFKTVNQLAKELKEMEEKLIK